jgi:hypothetical protein
MIQLTIEQAKDIQRVYQLGLNLLASGGSKDKEFFDKIKSNGTNQKVIEILTELTK